MAKIKEKQEHIELLKARIPSLTPPKPSTSTTPHTSDELARRSAIFAASQAIPSRSPAHVTNPANQNPSLFPPLLNSIGQNNCFDSGHFLSSLRNGPSALLNNTPAQSMKPTNPFETEIFLRPTRIADPTRGKPLRIIDFVCRLRPSDDERILSSDDNCKLTLSLNDSKPKLSSVSVEQYNIANLRIFYELLCSNKLNSMQDVRDYLTFSIKALELATKYTWESVLLYDDEFRILQHTYGFPWSTDNSHLHEVALIPRWAAGLHRGNNGHNPPPRHGGINSSGNESNAFFSNKEFIHHSSRFRLRNFQAPCKYSHSCNGRVGSQACGKSHPGCHHPGDIPGQ